MSILKSDSYDEVIQRANDTAYDLAVVVITKDSELKKNVRHHGA